MRLILRLGLAPLAVAASALAGEGGGVLRVALVLVMAAVSLWVVRKARKTRTKDEGRSQVSGG